MKKDIIEKAKIETKDIKKQEEKESMPNGIAVNPKIIVGGILVGIIGWIIAGPIGAVFGFVIDGLIGKFLPI